MFKHVAAGLALVLFVLAAPVQATGSQAHYVEGDQYVTIASPQRYSSAGKVEVVEVFSYACPYCARFAPYMDKLAHSLPAGVTVHYVPAAFSPAWEPSARAYLAARQLGIAKATHLEVFHARFVQHYPLNSLSDFAAFYADRGANAKTFLSTAHSAKTTNELRADQRLIRRWGVDRTPTIVVNGKYRSNHIASYPELVALTRWLVARELKANAAQH